jgi:hypothetical protein
MPGQNTIGQTGCDPLAFDTTIFLGSYATGLALHTDPLSTAAISIFSRLSNDAGTRIVWNNNNGNFYFGNNDSNGGMTGCFAAGPGPGAGCLNSVSTSILPNPSALLAELEWTGWMRLSGQNNSKDSYLEFGITGLPTSTRVQIQSCTSIAGVFGQVTGLDFFAVTGSGLGTATPIFSLGGGGPTGVPFAGWPAQGTSGSPAANKNSADLLLGTAVYTGSTSAVRPAILRATPGLNGNNAAVTLHAMFYGSPSYNTISLADAFSISESGTLFFGQVCGFTGTNYGISFDPSALVTPNVIRTVAWPNLAGGALVVQPTSTGVPGTSQAAGTAGEVRWDTTHVYVCFATGSGASDRWLKATAASSW